MMASLPSVVLGFLAALVIAPFVRERRSRRCWPLFLTVPLVAAPRGAPLAAAAAAARGAPGGLAAARSRSRGSLLALGVLSRRARRPGGRARALRRRPRAVARRPGRRQRLGGWIFLLLPLAAGRGRLFVELASWSPLLRGVAARAGRRGPSRRVDLVKFLAGGALAVGARVALAARACSTALGLDPRGGLVGTYVQRNALVVGFVMGFAIIPIIYTIAEDALSSVPEHLRARLARRRRDALADRHAHRHPDRDERPLLGA